jgi:hypothetical protein
LINKFIIFFERKRDHDYANSPTRADQKGRFTLRLLRHVLGDIV